MRDVSNVCGVDYTQSKFYRDKKSAKAWHFILYPDSEYYNYNWVNDLEDTLLPVVYVLHDKDVYDKDKFDKKTGLIIHKKGEFKKSHYHISFYYGNATKFTTALDIVELCGGCRLEPIVDRVKDVRYMTHIDYPDKWQYNIDDVKTLGNFPLEKYYYSDEVEIEIHIQDMLDFCKLNYLWTLNQFIDYARVYRKDWWSLYLGRNKCRAIISDFIKNQGYEVRHFKGNSGVEIINKRAVEPLKYYLVPLYDESHKMILDGKGGYLADKQIIIA